MDNGANYWGNASGENTETDNKSGRPDCYPGKQSTKGPMKPVAEAGDKDSIVMPAVNK